MPNDAPYDSIIVGSGAGGGPLAANLAKAGFTVLLLEAGGDLNPDVFVFALTTHFQGYFPLYFSFFQNIRHIPGYFIVLPISMISEKAFDVIVRDAKGTTA